MAKRKSMKRGIQRVDVNLYGDEFMDIVERRGDEAMFAAGEVVLREATARATRAHRQSSQKRLRSNGIPIDVSETQVLAQGKDAA